MRRQILWRQILWLVPLSAIFFGACGPAAPASPPFNTVATTKQIMLAIIDPAADAVWEAAGSILTVEGEIDLAPASDEGWAAVQNHALALAESGNLLMMGNRAGGSDEFIRLARQLTELSARAAKAAEAKDATAIFDLGAEIYAVCSSCHQQFITTAPAADTPVPPAVPATPVAPAAPARP